MFAGFLVIKKIVQFSPGGSKFVLKKIKALERACSSVEMICEIFPWGSPVSSLVLTLVAFCTGKIRILFAERVLMEGKSQGQTVPGYIDGVFKLLSMYNTHLKFHYSSGWCTSLVLSITFSFTSPKGPFDIGTYSVGVPTRVSWHASFCNIFKFW